MGSALKYSAEPGEPDRHRGSREELSANGTPRQTTVDDGTSARRHYARALGFSSDLVDIVVSLDRGRP